MLVDAEIVASIFKGLSTAVYYEKVMLGAQVAISFQTLAELQVWARQNNWSEERQAKFEQYLDHYVVVYADFTICRIWSEICYASQHFKERQDASVAWVGATALALECPLVTGRPGKYDIVPGLTFITDPHTHSGRQFI